MEHDPGHPTEKHMNDIPQPPRWADKLLAWYCNPALLEDLQGDLHERFHNRIRSTGLRWAKVHYFFDVIAFLRPYVFKKKRADGPRYSMLFNHYSKTSFRNFKRDKQYFTINSLGLALGIACSLILIAYIFNELTFDSQFANSGRIYRITVSTIIDDKRTDFAPIPPAVALAIRDEIPEIETMARISYPFAINNGTSTVRYEQNSFYQQNVFLADPTIFDVLSFRFLDGNTNALTEPNRIVLTHSLARKLFGVNYLQGAGPAGKIITIDKHEFAVNGIIADPPSNSHFHPSAFISWEGYGNDNIWDDSHAYTYVLLKENASHVLLQEKIDRFMKTNENILAVAEAFGAGVEASAESIHDIHLQPAKMYELSGHGHKGYLIAFGAIALFFLLSSGINYTNLAIAASAHRYKEIGVRKVMGALSGQIQKQFLTESAFMTVGSVALALIMLYLMIPHFNRLMTYELDTAILVDPGFLALAVAVILVLILLAGLYPALYLSRFNPVYIFKNRPETGSSKLHFRKTLLAVQFAISSFMILAVIVIGIQMNYLGNKELGFNKENIAIISIPDTYRREIQALKQELQRIAGVNGAAACDYSPGLSEMIDEHFVERENGEMKSSTVSRLHFDKDFLDLLGLDIVQGRNFKPDNEADYRHAFLVNEAAVKAYGWDKSPEGAIGRKIDGFNYGKAGTVIGVVKNVNLFSLMNKIQPLVMNLSVYENFLYVRVDGRQTKEVMSSVESAYKKMFDGHPFEYHFLDERFERLYENDRTMNAVLLTGSQLLIFISCLGLFGLSAFMVTKRTREIGIRKVLGATLQQIFFLLSRDFVWLVIAANLVAVPVAYLLLQQWLEGYAYRVAISWWLLPLPFIITLLLSMLSITYQVIRVSGTDPVKVLKYE